MEEFFVKTLSRLLLYGPIIAIFVGTTQASIITFEDLPDPYLFGNSGGQNIDSFYSGFQFGPNVTGLSMSRFGGYDDAAYPPHSGDVAVWDPFDNTISIAFSSPIDNFAIWYTSLDPLELDAY